MQSTISHVLSPAASPALPNQVLSQMCGPSSSSVLLRLEASGASAAEKVFHGTQTPFILAGTAPCHVCNLLRECKVGAGCASNTVGNASLTPREAAVAMKFYSEQVMQLFHAVVQPSTVVMKAEPHFRH